MRTGIVDYGVGNVRSVANALQALGADVELCATPTAIRAMQRLILPGVGAFGEAMQRLAPLREVIEEARHQKPILGICLGMQLFAERSFEHGEHKGLGWIAGEVKALAPPDLPVPMVGWNTLRRKKDSALLSDMREDASFYFVHSYHFVPTDPAVVTGVTDYGGDVVAVIEHGRLFATQFHPEKSQKDGLRLLEAFLRC